MQPNQCKVLDCKHTKARRYLLCRDCWLKLPGDMRHQDMTRPKPKSPDKPQYSLRINPPKEWFERAMKYVGKIKVPYILGSGHSAYKVAADKSEV